MEPLHYAYYAEKCVKVLFLTLLEKNNCIFTGSLIMTHIDILSYFLIIVANADHLSSTVSVLTRADATVMGL